MIDNKTVPEPTGRELRLILDRWVSENENVIKRFKPESISRQGWIVKASPYNELVAYELDDWLRAEFAYEESAPLLLFLALEHNFPPFVEYLSKLNILGSNAARLVTSGVLSGNLELKAEEQ